MIIWFLVVTPIACGFLYITVMRSDNRTIYDIWARGTAIMLAGFSFCYNAITRGAKPEKIHNWNPKYWLCISAIFCLIGLCVTGYKFVSRLRKKERLMGTQVKLVDRHLIPAIVMSICMLVLATVLIKPYEDGILPQYVKLCSGDEVTDILIDPIVSFYCSVNTITGSDSLFFLTIIIPIFFLLLSVGGYDFVAERLFIPKEKRKVFLMLIYGMLIITYMSRDYYLFGIYTNLWEPMTVFVSIFLPFQFGMMMYVMDTVNFHELNTVTKLVFWSLITGLLGYLFRFMDPLIVFAPTVAGASVGYIGKKLKPDERER